jgi:hypothetical protein
MVFGEDSDKVVSKIAGPGFSASLPGQGGGSLGVCGEKSGLKLFRFPSLDGRGLRP